MDLRFVAFDLIARDAGLRALLVNYADRIDGIGPDTCFLALEWTDDDRARAGAELLTARVHMPRRRSSEHVFLDVVLERLRAALTVDPVRGPIAARCLGTSRELTRSEVDTIFTTITFEIAPAARRRTAADLLTLAPWTGGAHCGTAGVIPPHGAVAGMN